MSNHDDMVTAAISEGRIRPADAQAWRDRLAADEEGFAPMLAALPVEGAVPLTETGYNNTKPPAMTPEAEQAMQIWESMSRASRSRAEVAAVYCPQCPRALLTVQKINGEFLAIPKGKKANPHERNDFSEDAESWVAVQPFIMGQTWTVVPCRCQCGYGHPLRGYIDVRKLFIALNQSGQRRFTVGVSPL